MHELPNEPIPNHRRPPTSSQGTRPCAVPPLARPRHRRCPPTPPVIFVVGNAPVCRSALGPATSPSMRANTARHLRRRERARVPFRPRPGQATSPSMPTTSAHHLRRRERARVPFRPRPSGGRHQRLNHQTMPILTAPVPPPRNTVSTHNLAKRILQGASCPRNSSVPAAFLDRIHG
jgi:hypothetical protein